MTERLFEVRRLFYDRIQKAVDEVDDDVLRMYGDWLKYKKANEFKRLEGCLGKAVDDEQVRQCRKEFADQQTQLIAQRLAESKTKFKQCSQDVFTKFVETEAKDDQAVRQAD